MDMNIINKKIINDKEITNTMSVMLLGSGELGKGLAIAFKRYGLIVYACDNYDNAPAMQVADYKYVFSMKDPVKLEEHIKDINPDFIVPEIEAINTDILFKMEKIGFNIVPNARAVNITMNRNLVRQLVSHQLKLPTSEFCFAHTSEQLLRSLNIIGFPCIIKPIMSSSGKGQYILKSYDVNIEELWNNNIDWHNGVIIEKFINFDYEVTMLTVRHKDGTTICEPIGHVQKNGDFQMSWQPHHMSKETLQECQRIAKITTDNLGGYGIFGVELFILHDGSVMFNEISPRPHDTGMITEMSQNLSEFDLHVRAILGISIPEVKQLGPCASKSLKVNGPANIFLYKHVSDALKEPDTELHIFGKREIRKNSRRMGVAYAKGDNIEEAKQKVERVLDNILVFGFF